MKNFFLLFFSLFFSLHSSDFIKGIYINQKTTFSKVLFNKMLEKSKFHGVNAWVLDVQPRVPSKESIKLLKQNNIRTIARLVVFPLGLAEENPPPKRMDALKNKIFKACKAGFEEIQLDYIRFSDKISVKLTYSQKYKKVASVIDEFKNSIKQNCQNIDLGADIFGRVAFNSNDPIGQKVENFVKQIPILYPMLYPSHFFQSRNRQKDPYQTIYDGVKSIQKRSPDNIKVIPYIQGFDMLIKRSGLSLEEYIFQQMKASFDSESEGFIVWNIHNSYKQTFAALNRLKSN